MTRGRQSNARNKPRAIPPPPYTLGDDEAKLWREVCLAQNAEWLDTGPGPLLENYCFAVVRMRALRIILRIEAASPDNKGRISDSDLEQLDSMSKIVERLSRALRLTPQSRIRADKSSNSPAMPWDQHPEDDGDTA